MVEVLRLEVVKVEMDEIRFPPAAASYQRYEPVEPEALNVTEPDPHLELPVVLGAAGLGFTLATTGVLVLSHPLVAL